MKFTTRGYVWPMKILDPDTSRLNSLRRTLLVLLFALNFFSAWVIPVTCVCTCVCAHACASNCAWVASENQALVEQNKID